MRALARLAAAAFVAAVTSLLLLDFSAVEAQLPQHADKVSHALLFFGVAICLAVLFRNRRPALTATTALALGGLTEILQGLAGRDAGFGDFAADVAGVAAWLLCEGVRRALAARRNQPAEDDAALTATRSSRPTA